MAINPRTKGAEGEREAAKLLNSVIAWVMTDMGSYSPEEIEAAQRMVQRNQNQSAVGGCDLTNVFGIAVEIKRQETLNVPEWWRQTVRSAERNGELPLLMYRQNRKAWHFRTYGQLFVPATNWKQLQAVVEFDETTFRQWFSAWVRGKLELGYEIRT